MMRISGLVVFVCAALAAGQNDTHSLRDRYDQVLMARPSRGVAFERVYQSYADNEGIEVWLTALNAKSEDAPSALIAGYIYERQGKEQAALKAYLRSAKLSPDQYRAHAARGQLFWHLRLYADSAESLKLALDRKPPPNELRELQKMLGRVYAAAGEGEQAVAAWLKLAELFPDDSVTLEELADLLVEEDRPDEAIEQYQKLQQVSDDDYMKVRAAMSIAQIHADRRHYDKAHVILKIQLASLAPDSWLRAEARRRLEQTYRDQKKPESIITFYQQWLKDRPDDVELRLALAHTHHRQGDNESAQRVLKQIIEQAGSRCDARSALAELYLEQGQYQDAAAAYEKLCEMAPGEARLWERLGRIYINDLELKKKIREQQAIRAWRNIYSQRPEDASRAVLAAEVLRNALLTEPAIEHYQKAIELEPDNISHYEYLGQYFVELDRRDEAIEQFKAIVAGQRDVPANHVRFVEVLAQFKFDEQCLASIDPALSRVEDGARRFMLQSIRAAVLMRTKESEAANKAVLAMQAAATTYSEEHETRLALIELYEQTEKLEAQATHLTSRAKTADDYELLALIHRAMSNQTQANGAIEQATQLDANNADRLTLAAQMYQQSGELHQAIELRKRLIKLQPQHEIEHLQELAQLARRQADWKTAEQAANRLIEKSPQSERGYQLAAEIQTQMGQPAKATKTLRQGVRRNPRDTLLLTALAQNLQSEGRTQEAIDCYWRSYDASDQEHDKLRAASELAKIHVQIGRFDQLVDYLNQRRYDPEQSHTAVLALADAYKLANKPQRARSLLHRELAQRPNDSQLLDQLMSLSEELGLSEQAINYGEKLMAMRPDDAQLKQRMGTLLYEAGHTDQAITLWRTSITSASRDNMETSLRLASTLAKHGLHDDALETLTAAARKSPDDWKLMYRLALQFKMLGQQDRAASMLDQLIERDEPDSATIATSTSGRNMSYMGFNNQPPLINQWTSLQHIQNMIGNELQRSRRGRMGLFSFGMSYRNVGTSNQYTPPDFSSAQLAALIHRLHLAEINGQLPEYFGQLAGEAGYPLKIKDQFVTPDPLPKTSGSDKAKLRLLRALLLARLTDQAYQALTTFQKQSPDNHDYIALLAVMHVYPQQTFRPSTLPDDADPTKAIEALAAIDPKAAAVLVPMYVQQLITEGRTEDALRWLNRSLEESDHLMPTLTTLMMLARTGKPEAQSQALRQTLVLLPQIRDHLRTTTGQQQYRPLHYLGAILTTSINANDLDTAADLLIAYLDMFTATSSKSSSKSRYSHRYMGSASIFSLDKEEHTKFPSPNRLIGQAPYQALQQWFAVLKQNGRLDEMTQSLLNRTQQSDSHQAAQAIMPAVIVYGFNEQYKDAAALIDKTLQSSDDDRLRLVYAQVLIQLDRYDDAAATLQQVRATIGSIATESQTGLVIISSHLKDKTPAIKAARRLARSRLKANQMPRMVTYLGALKMTDEVARLKKKIAKSSTRGGAAQQLARQHGRQQGPNRRMQLLQNMLKQKNYDAAARLAKRIIRDKGNTTQNRNGDPEVNRAIQALKKAGQLDKIIADLESQFEKNPTSTALMSQLWLYHTAMGKQKKARAVLEKLFAASPNNMQVRYQYAVTLARQGSYQAATPHFEKVLESDPAIITEGWMIAHSFRESGKIDKLVELIEKSKPAKQRLSVMPSHMSQRNWVFEIAQQLQHQDARAALRLYRKARTMDLQNHYQAYMFNSIIDIAIRLKDAQVVIDELPYLLPENIKTQGAGNAQQYKAIAGTLFMKQQQNQPSPFVRMVKLLKKADKLDELEKAIAKGSGDQQWDNTIGQPALAILAINKKEPDFEPAKSLLESIKQKPAANDHYAIQWRAALASSLAQQLAKSDETLPLAAEFAATVEIKGIAAQIIQPHTQIMLMSIEARAAAKAGDQETARKTFEKIVKYTNPQRHRYIGMGSNQTFWIDFQDFQAKSPYVKDMVAYGYPDMAVDMLLDYEAKFTGGRQHERQQFDQIVKKLLKDKKLSEQINKRVAAMREQLDKNPDDTKLAKRMMRLYQMTDQAEQAMALADKMGDTNLFSPAEQVKIAKQHLDNKHKDRARKLILALIRSGNGRFIQNSHQFRALFNDRQSCEQLVQAIEQMPRKPETVEQGMNWINNFTQPIRQAASGKKGEELDALRDMGIRIVIVADQFSGVPTRYSHRPHNRQYLSYVTRQLRRYKSTQAAYDYARQAIFEADKTGLPEPSTTQLFAHTGTRNNMLQCLATMLVLNAHESNKLDELEKLVAKRRKQDTTWSNMGLRLTALIALQRDDMDLATKLIREVMDNPAIDPAVGHDRSITYFVHRTAKHESMIDLTMEQVDLLMLSMGNSRDAGNQIQTIGPMIVLVYAKSGDMGKTQAALEQAFNIMSTRYRGNNQYIVRQMLALSRLVGSIHRDNGRTALATDYYRVMLRFPFDRANTLTGDTTRGNLPDVVMQLLRQLEKDGELESYIKHIDVQYKKMENANAEPLITTAVCRIIQGRLDDARLVLEQIGEEDYLAGAPLLLHAIEKLPEETRLKAIALIDPIFSRTPYLFTKDINKLLKLYGSAKRPLSVSDEIKALLAENTSSSSTQPSGRRRRGILGTNSATLIVFDGFADVPGALIPSEEDRAELTRQLLTNTAKHFEKIKDEDALLELIDWAYPYLDKKIVGPKWIIVLSKKDPGKAYDMALKMIALSDKILSVQALFNTNLAMTIIEMAHEQDRMAELATACKAFTPAIVRLRLLVAAAQNVERFKDMLPAFLKGQSPYALDDRILSLSKCADPALAALIQVCLYINPKQKLHLPALFNASIKANEKYVVALQEKYPDRDHYFIDSKPWMQMIEAQFELGENQDAIDTCQRLLDKHMKKASTVGGIQYRGDARGDMSCMAQLAVKYNEVTKMATLLNKIEKKAVDIDGMSEAFPEPLNQLQPTPAGAINE